MEEATTEESPFTQDEDFEHLDAAVIIDQAKSLSPTDANFHSLVVKLEEALNERHEHEYRQLAVSSRPSSSQVHLAQHSPSFDNHHRIRGGYIEEESNKSLNSDTIVLVGSLIVMIIIGLVFNQLMTFFAKLKERRRQYKNGLKQLGEHMDAVTRTMSNNVGIAPQEVEDAEPSFAPRKVSSTSASEAVIVLEQRIAKDDDDLWKSSSTSAYVKHQELHRAFSFDGRK